MNIDPHTPLVAELQPRSFFNRALVCRAPIHGADAYRFVYKKFVMTVYKHGAPIATTDGCKYLQLGDLRYAWPGRFYTPLREFVAADEAFYLVWGLHEREQANRFDGIRISVKGHPDEVYMVSTNESWFGCRPHVIVHATCGKVHLDRMMALLAYFWAREEDYRRSG